MSTITRYFDRLEYADQLIFQARTGPAHEFAAKLNLGPSQLKSYLQDLREKGVPIKYCYSRRTYYYERPGRFFIRFARAMTKG